MPTTRLAELFAQIDGLDFAAELSIANSALWIATFVKNNKATRELTLMARIDNEVAHQVGQHVDDLLLKQTDPKLLHPFDKAVAAYLLILHDSNVHELVQSLKVVYDGRPPNLWWTYRIYNHLLALLPAATTSYRFDLAPVEPQPGMRRVCEGKSTGTAQARRVSSLG